MGRRRSSRGSQDLARKNSARKEGRQDLGWQDL